MGRHTNTKRRVLGPYWVESRKQWRIVIIDPIGERGQVRRVDGAFTTEADALNAKEDIEASWAQLDQVMVQEAIGQYMEFLQAKGTKEVSRVETRRRLSLFFAPVLESPLYRLTPARGKQLYEATIKGRSVDYHRNMLAESRSFLRWCTDDRGWLRVNPLEKVKGIGKRKKGKAQLTRDEARKLGMVACGRAASGDDGAMAVLLALLLGVRASEITKRQVRDIDDEGAILRITAAKTEKGNRTLAIPEFVQPLLMARIANRGPLEPLFPSETGGYHWRDWVSENTRRLCKLAKVQVVCAHGLRGTHATLAQLAGTTSEAVAASLGHETFKTTKEHYTNAGAVQAANQQKVFAVIRGGK